jgi:hypothetical protein
MKPASAGRHQRGTVGVAVVIAAKQEGSVGKMLASLDGQWGIKRKESSTERLKQSTADYRSPNRGRGFLLVIAPNRHRRSHHFVSGRAGLQEQVLIGKGTFVSPEIPLERGTYTLRTSMPRSRNGATAFSDARVSVTNI